MKLEKAIKRHWTAFVLAVIIPFSYMIIGIIESMP